MNVKDWQMNPAGDWELEVNGRRFRAEMLSGKFWVSEKTEPSYWELKGCALDDLAECCKFVDELQVSIQ